MQKIFLLIVICLLSISLFAKEYQINPNKEYEIGSVKKDGYEVKIYQNTFPENTVLNIEKQGKTGCDITVKGHENEFYHFYNPIRLTFYIDDTDNPQNYLVGYTDEKGVPHYYIPEHMNLKKKYAVYYINHFTGWSLFKPSKEEVIKTFSTSLCTKKWEREKQLKNLKSSSSKYLDNFFKEMKIDSKETRNKLIADFFSVIEPESTYGIIDFTAQNINNYKNKDSKAIAESTVKFCSENIMRVLEKDTKIVGVPAGALGNLTSAAGFIMEGDTKDAMREIGNAMRNCDATTEFATCLAEFTGKQLQNAVNYIGKNELEDAYLLYTGKGVGYRGLDMLEGDINGCIDYLGIGGGIINVNAMKSYSEALGMDYNNLTQKQREFIENKVRSDIKNYFEDRKKADAYIQKNIEKEKDFINELDKAGLLSKFESEEYFGSRSEYDLEFRLIRLHNIKESILSYLDDEELKYIDNEALAGLVKDYIDYAKKKKSDKFIDHLIEIGYATKAPGYEPKKEKTFLEQLDDINKSLEEFNKKLSKNNNKNNKNNNTDKKTEKTNPNQKKSTKSIKEEKLVKGAFNLTEITYAKETDCSIADGKFIFSTDKYRATAQTTVPAKVIYPDKYLNLESSIYLDPGVESDDSYTVYVYQNIGQTEEKITLLGGNLKKSFIAKKPYGVKTKKLTSKDSEQDGFVIRFYMNKAVGNNKYENFVEYNYKWIPGDEKTKEETKPAVKPETKPQENPQTPAKKENKEHGVYKLVEVEERLPDGPDDFVWKGGKGNWSATYKHDKLSISATVSFSQPPAKLSPGQSFSMTRSIKLNASDKCFQRVECRWACTRGSINSSEYFKVELYNEKSKSDSETVTMKISDGIPTGYDEFNIVVQPRQGTNASTIYKYKYIK